MGEAESDQVAGEVVGDTPVSEQLERGPIGIVVVTVRIRKTLRTVPKHPKRAA